MPVAVVESAFVTASASISVVATLAFAAMAPASDTLASVSVGICDAFGIAV